MSLRTIDPSRLPTTPCATLRDWERQSTANASALDTLERDVETALTDAAYTDLSEICNRVANLALVEPQRARESLPQIDRVAAQLGFAIELTETKHPRLLLAAVDLLHISDCLRGSPFVAASTRDWLLALERSQLSPADLVRVGCAAIIRSDWDIAYRLAGLEITPGTVPPPRGIRRSDDVLPRTIYDIASAGGDAYEVQRYCFAMLRDWAIRRRTDEIDESALLWLLRIAHHEILQHPLSQVLEQAHAHLWNRARDFEDRQAEEDKQQALRDRHFPKGDTVAHTFVAEARLHGMATQTIWTGREHDTGAPVVLSIDHRYSDASLSELLHDVSYNSPGVLELAHVGLFDPHRTNEPGHERCQEQWAVVEYLGVGTWLPSMLPDDQEPSRAIRMALELGRSAGEILAEAARRDVLLWGIRPEYMWAERQGEHWRVTNLSGRGAELFRRARGEQNEFQIFDRRYSHRDPSSDHCVVSPLAAMIAEWATGNHHRSERYGRAYGWAADLVALLPSPLSELLTDWLRPSASAPPGGLTGFLAELDRVATHF